MRRCRRIVVLTLLMILAGTALAHLEAVSGGDAMTVSARKFLAALSQRQRAKALLDYETPKRVDWHFIPKNRKGVRIKDMTPPQRKAGDALLRSALSELGYGKANKIMALESVLRVLEGKRGAGGNRDAELYYFTIFAPPTEDGRWGLSIEGHHLSLNFVVHAGEVISSTPMSLGANPGLVMDEAPNCLPKGTRVLAKEELLAFKLLDSLSDEQRSVAVISGRAPREIRAAGAPQPPVARPLGLAAAKMTEGQLITLRALVGAYVGNLPKDVADARLKAIGAAGWGKIHFAWAGAQKPGVGHYYRLQSPAMLVELVNTQPDAAGNPANHIHSVWRDPTGDFAIPLAK